MSTLNLDQKAAQFAQTMVTNAKKVKDVSKPIDTLERLVTKTLGVLQEQGVYAMMLFLFSRTKDEEKVSKKIRPHLYQLLGELPAFKDNNELKKLAPHPSTAEVLKFYSDHVCNELDNLLLIRDLYEQTLIYARFGAKAEGK